MPATTPDGIPLTPDVPDALATPPGVPRDTTTWIGDRPSESDGDRLRYALFSGGDDSLSMVHHVMSRMDADAVLYLNTNTGLADTYRYVVDVCRRFEWPLRVERSPVSLAELGMTYGFPGSAYHTVAYAYLKERQLSAIAGEYDGPPTYVTGVRKHESDRRMTTVPDDRRSTGEGGRWTWVQPIRGWTDGDVVDYRECHGLPRNPVAAAMHRSGDCYCGAFAHRDELLVDLRSNGYDRHATWLLAVEARVQIYRGRLAVFERRYPDEWAAVDDRRDDCTPKPMRLSVAREVAPDAAADIDAIGRDDALAVGRDDARNYWGHGDMANDELRALVAEHDVGQAELCQFCDGGGGRPDE
jgi:3'-phosphoadenosine 5'-phosphosulfate sulfotransferase (PAPS reductase)/FAD synthetase